MTLSNPKLPETCLSTLYTVIEKSGHLEASLIEELWEAAAKIFARIPMVVDTMSRREDWDFWRLVVRHPPGPLRWSYIKKRFEKNSVGGFLELQFSKKRPIKCNRCGGLVSLSSPRDKLCWWGSKPLPKGLIGYYIRQLSRILQPVVVGWYGIYPYIIISGLKIERRS